MNTKKYAAYVTLPGDNAQKPPILYYVVVSGDLHAGWRFYNAQGVRPPNGANEGRFSAGEETKIVTAMAREWHPNAAKIRVEERPIEKPE